MDEWNFVSSPKVLTGNENKANDQTSEDDDGEHLAVAAAAATTGW